MTLACMSESNINALSYTILAQKSTSGSLLDALKRNMTEQLELKQKAVVRQPTPDPPARAQACTAQGAERPVRVRPPAGEGKALRALLCLPPSSGSWGPQRR